MIALVFLVINFSASLGQIHQDFESISQKILQEEVIEGEDLKNLLAETKMPA